jgi:hypothetical protein
VGTPFLKVKTQALQFLLALLVLSAGLLVYLEPVQLHLDLLDDMQILSKVWQIKLAKLAAVFYKLLGPKFPRRQKQIRPVCEWVQCVEPLVELMH